MSKAERLKLVNQASINYELMMQHKSEAYRIKNKNEELVLVINALKKSMRYNRVQELENEVEKLRDYSKKIEQIQGAYTVPQSDAGYVN